MIRRVLGWLRSGDPVVEQPAPPDMGVHAQEWHDRYRVAYELMDARRILDLVRAALQAEASRPAEMRNQPLVDLALDVRSVILPPVSEPEPAPRVRASVPVIPGGGS